jgi:integrase/recombinase XerC
LRVIGVMRWFEFIQAQGWFPSEFSSEQAIALLKTKNNTPESTQSAKPEKAVTIEHDLTDFLGYYQTQKPSKAIQGNSEQFRRWELTRLRNHALIQLMAETGGQVSAVLNLNVVAIEHFEAPLAVELNGKNEHPYSIGLTDSLPALKSYLQLRAVPADVATTAPLFISHANKHDGQRMSRIIAWRVIQRAAQALKLPEVSPHDLRHWRAKQLIDAGHSPEEVQQKLGHRTIQTIHAYYGHWYKKEEEL